MSDLNKNMNQSDPIYVPSSEVYAIPVSPSAPGASNGINPPIPPPTAPATSTLLNELGDVNEGGALEYLMQWHWPKGLQNIFISNLKKIPLRFYILDDSGSMSSNDGHRLVDSPKGKTMVGCTRWEELTCSVKFLAGVAKASGAATEFRVLNGSAPIMIGNGDANEADRYQILMSLLSDSPGGGTPLCKHVREVIEKIRPMEDQLRANGQKVCVVIASDGESTDGNIAEAMRPLRSLPVWVVIRLCTDDERIVEYWNNIDNELELEMDVLDDFTGEAQELFEHNPWLTYGEPMHRLREFGVPVKEIDLMDETSLSMDQIRRMCTIIFGGYIEDYPHPEADFAGFLAVIQKNNNSLSKVWNPISQRMTDWINIAQLKSVGKKGSCTLS